MDKILILTHKRYDRQVTWDSLTPELRDQTILVVQDGEQYRYNQKYEMRETPPGLKGIALTRQWCLEQEWTKILMLDDDLTFAKRRIDDPTKFTNPLPVETEVAFSRLFTMLDTYAHVGMLAREGGNRSEPGIKENARAMRFLGYNCPMVKFAGCSFTPGLTQDDFDMTLQLLRKGYKNGILCDFVQNQSGGSGSAGGASDYRTIETHNASVKRLAELHPGFVTVVEKHTKVAWGGQPRLDVICQWKSAYESSQR